VIFLLFYVVVAVSLAVCTLWVLACEDLKAAFELYAVSLAICILWVWTAKPVSYNVLELGTPLREALTKLQDKGYGHAIVDDGTLFLQFFIRPGSREITLDIPAPQLQKLDSNLNLLGFLGFKSSSFNHIELHQKDVATVEEAVVAAGEVFGALFKWQLDIRVTLETDFSKVRRP
jgi:hypothetical protein